MKRFNATRLPLVRAVSAASVSLALSGCLAGAVCGDGVIDSGEICDDANSDNADFCGNDCKIGPLVAVEGFIQKEVDSTDVLLVVDNSGSMFEEQINFMAQLENIIADLGNSGAPFRFAAVTTDSDANPAGNFFTTPADVKLGNGTVVRDFPNNSGTNSSGGVDNNNFCNDVMALSEGGVLASDNPALAALIANFGPIPDFTGRISGFQDANNDKVADNLITPTFTDAVGCLLTVGIRGSGQEVALCQAVAALDPDSLLGNNSAFLRTPNSVLGVIVISDEDDGTSTFTEENGVLTCQPLALGGSPIQSLLSTQSVEENVCGTGVHGEFENLRPVQDFVDRIKALRDEEHLYVATLAGPPTPAVADCENLFPVPSCSNESTGSASPGNRYFEFVSQFAHRSDAFENSICGNPVETIGIVNSALVKTVDFDCLDTDLNAAFGGAFDIAKNIKVSLDLSNTGVSCSSLGAIASDASGECLLSTSAIALNAKASCGGGFELDSPSLGLPNGTRVQIEFRN